MLSTEEKEELIGIVPLLSSRGLISPLSGGCLSIRKGDYFAITPDTFNPFTLKAEDLIILNVADGSYFEGNGRPNINYMFHALTYSRRRDARLIIFGTPPYATLLSATNLLPKTDLFVQSWMELGEIRKSTYALAGSAIFTGRVAEELMAANAVLLENYGVAVVASDPLQGYYRMELLENVSKMTVSLSKPIVKPFNSRQKLEIESTK